MDSTRMRLAWGLPLPMVFVVACVTTHRIVPESGRAVARDSTKQGITLTAVGDAWNMAPHEVPEYLTPIWVEIENSSDTDVAVNYGDFALSDERGFRYAAINPFTGAAEPSSPSSPQDRDEGEEEESKEARTEPGRPVLLAALGPGVATVSRAGATVTRAGAPEAERRVARVTHRLKRRAPYRGRRFRVYPRRRAYYHYYVPWRGYVYWPPRYHVHVHGWPDAYPSPPPDSVRRLALPEGVVEKNGQVAGFVYFQNVVGRAHRLRLVWNARTPEGRIVAEPSVAFRVVLE